VLCACGGGDPAPVVDAIGEPLGHTTHATWQVQNLDGSNAGCPAGFDQAAVVSWRSDQVGLCGPGAAPSDTCHVSYFACDAGQGTTAPLPAGTYITTVGITSHDHAQLYAQSLPAVLDLGTDQATAATIYNDAGYFSATWTLVGRTSGATLACDAAGATQVSVVTTRNGAASHDKFPCAAGHGFTMPLRAGAYTFGASAIDDTGAARGAATVLTSSIQAKNAVTELGALVLEVDD